jgi:DNA-directed RNA polymerase subunit RPC12/RpoP
MQVRCQRCSFMFTLSHETLLAALEEVEKTPAKHYNIECPKCRRQIKVPAKEIRRFQPPQESGAAPAS